MMTALYASQTTPSMMVEQYTIDGVATKRCSGCNKTGTTTIMKVIARWTNEEHVVVHCSDDRCSWGDCKIHLVFTAPTPIQHTVVYDVEPTELPSLFDNDNDMPDLFGVSDDKQLPNLF